jgi:uncharacterized membrane protein YdbT with pleckstrin-like domain
MDSQLQGRGIDNRGAGPAEPPTERVVVPATRKHWIVLAKGLAVPVVVGAAVLVFAAPLGGIWVLAALVLAAAGLRAGWVMLVWAVATVTVTEERVIIKEGVLIRKTKVIPLDRIQDVSTRQNLFGQLLDYGSLEIDTAGRIENEVVTHLPAPQWLREQVFGLLDPMRRSDTGV